MRKIINGKLYDTDKAQELGSYHYLYPGDFDWTHEVLYRKRTGEFFTWGEGGPRSRYAVSEDHGWSGGQAITPISFEEAQAWAEEHLDADEYEAIFGEVSEDAEDVVISAKLPAAVDAKLRRMAAEAGTSVTAMIIRLIEEQ